MRPVTSVMAAAPTARAASNQQGDRGTTFLKSFGTAPGHVDTTVAAASAATPQQKASPSAASPWKTLSSSAIATASTPHTTAAQRNEPRGSNSVRARQAAQKTRTKHSRG